MRRKVIKAMTALDQVVSQNHRKVNGCRTKHWTIDLILVKPECA